MSTEQAGVVPSCSVYIQHGRLVMRNVRQWRHGQKRCPGGMHKGYEHGPEDKTRHYDKVYTFLTILQWVNPRSLAGGKGKHWMTYECKEKQCKGCGINSIGGSSPRSLVWKGQAAGDSAMKSVRWSPIFHLIFLFSFCFLHRKTLAPDCHKCLPVETNFFLHLLPSP